MNNVIDRRRHNVDPLTLTQRKERFYIAMMLGLIILGGCCDSILSSFGL